jgi:SpoVK/Ycf46/Vps4 family AAA+-type ATPase
VDNVAQLLLASEMCPRYIDTSLTWDDLVLDSETLQAVEHVLASGRHQIEPPTSGGVTEQRKLGILSLFHGPQGTGKTLTTCLLGKMLGRPVYCVDLSTVVSKNLDETTMNLIKLLGEAQQQNWLLMLEDASNTLFSRSAHSMSDENVSYLLQRVEALPGLVIFKTSLQDVTAVFAAYFQSTIFFGMPEFSDRLRLWQGCFGPECVLSPEIDLLTVAREYELSGGSIMNAFRYACVRRLERFPAVITLPDLLDGIQRELHKSSSEVA